MKSFDTFGDFCFSYLTLLKKNAFVEPISWDSPLKINQTIMSLIVITMYYNFVKVTVT